MGVPIVQLSLYCKCPYSTTIPILWVSQSLHVFSCQWLNAAWPTKHPLSTHYMATTHSTLHTTNCTLHTTGFIVFHCFTQHSTLHCCISCGTHILSRCIFPVLKTQISSYLSSFIENTLHSISHKIICIGYIYCQCFWQVICNIFFGNVFQLFCTSSNIVAWIPSKFGATSTK